MAAITSAVVGTTAAVAGTVMSFTQAAQQQRNIREAQAKADQAMQEARKKLEVNYYEQLAIQKEPYELQREALLVQGAQALEGAREADRGAAATAGRMQAMQNEAQAGVRTAMGKELMDLAALTATEESRLRDVGVQLDMGEIAGAQQAMSDAEQARSAAIQQGIQGIGNIATSVDKFVPLYPGKGNKTDFKQVQNKNLKNMNVMGSGMSSAYNAPLSQQQQIQQQVQPQMQNYAPGVGLGVLEQQYYQQPYEYNPFNYNYQPPTQQGFNFGKYD